MGKDISVEDAKNILNNLKKEYDFIKSQNICLDMTRGKPSKEQLDISNKMLDFVDENAEFIEEYDKGANIDVRNYGGLKGLKPLRDIFADVLEISSNNIIIGGSSSLNLMYDIISKAFTHGLKNSLKPWSKYEKIKFLCTVPGYDRHFSICETFNIEMINIELDDEGPNIKKIQDLIESDESIKGMWCVPKYSNPTGVVYSDYRVKALASLKPKAKDFTLFWDNAYFVHDLTDERCNLLNILDECKKNNNEDMFIGFVSTSKITFAGSGIALIYASVENINYIENLIKYQTIGYDKVNQLRHLKYLQSKQNLYSIMDKHKNIMYPKFKKIIEILDENFKGNGMLHYKIPKGGYFISVNTKKGCAKRVVEICKNLGLLITDAGSTYPYKKDVDDSNIRIAPSYLELNEIEKSTEIFCLAVKMAFFEKYLF